MSLAVLQDLPSSKELFHGDSTIQSLLGQLQTTFRFTFSKDKERHLKVTNFPSKNIKGWRFTQCNPPVISESHVVDYSASKGSEPPYIQVSVKPDQSEPVADEMSHALSIDGIQTSSDASTVQWNIEVSKNDLLSTTPSSIVPSVVAATSTERARAELVIAPVIPEVAYRVVSECISAFKHCGLGLHFLAEKLLEKKIINNRQKKKATDECSRCTTDERMDQLLDIIKDSVQQEGKVFEYILEILKDEDTILANKLYDDMINKYEQYK
uniref:CARD domain-containing protein n=1 Tax=Amphimedon queenslandica TaxID=400682 RepID=A0A1X7T927_AMPQE